MTPARSRPSLRFGIAALGGLVAALSLPPWGFWPLGPVGLALLAAALRHAGARGRAAAGIAFGVAQFGTGLFWMTEFHAVGYAAVVLLETSFFVAAAALVPGAPAAGLRRWTALPAAVVLAEAARGAVPFGGLPMAGIPLGQVGGPLAPLARAGGGLVLMGAAAMAGLALAEAVAGARGGRARGRNWAPLAVLAAVVLAAAAGTVAPPGGSSTGGRAIEVAVVQGGGERGFRGVDTDARLVFEAHLAASESIRPPVQLVVWPENTIDLVDIDGSPESRAVGDLARRLGATVVAGVTEDSGPDRFRNVAVAWSPEGEIVDRYVKAHRVPFGEYVPGRRFFERLADLSVLPRDAVAGRGAGVLTTPAGPLGVAISYEVFFADRVREAVRAGGWVVLVPTNAASFRTSQVPAQELAASRLRAWETGRWVVQSAPTGFGAIVDHEGRVVARTGLGRAEVVQAPVRLRQGRTLYVRWGDGPVLVLAVAGLAAAWTGTAAPVGGRRRYAAAGRAGRRPANPPSG